MNNPRNFIFTVEDEAFAEYIENHLAYECKALNHRTIRVHNGDDYYIDFYPKKYKKSDNDRYFERNEKTIQELGKIIINFFNQHATK